MDSPHRRVITPLDRRHPCPHRRGHGSAFPRRTSRGWRVPVRSVRLTDRAGHRRFTCAGIPGSPVGSAGATCLISTVDGSSRTPGVRHCAQRHGPRASLPASKASLQHFPRRTDRGWRVPVHPVRLTDLGRNGKFASAGKDARGPRVRSFQSPCGVLGVCRSQQQYAAEQRTAARFSPLAGF